MPIAKWLPGCAAWDRKRVSAEWDETGITLLRPAGKFFPISISLLIVEAAADTIGPTEVDTYLAEALHGAPFIRCNNGRWVYVLVEPVAARDWDVADAGCLGEETDLGVPCPDLVGAPRPYGVVLGGADGRAGRAGDEDDGDPARRLRPLQDGEAGGDAMTVAAQRTIDVTEVRKVYEAAFVRTSADGARSMRDQSEEPVRLLLLEVWAMRPVVEGAQDSLLEVVLRRAKEVLAEEPAQGTVAGARQVHDLATSSRALLTPTRYPSLLTQTPPGRGEHTGRVAPWFPAARSPHGRWCAPPSSGCCSPACDARRLRPRPRRPRP
ncbi:hypothetical protein [Streptomyces sp. NPDC052036]|uniref:hypothetical protein n=1 Tax=Streptomyces sp. NPDC052036 TaxID=3155171 RepID=UPI00342A2E94